MGKLSALHVKQIDRLGKYGDGDGLYLQVSASGRKSWIFRYMIDYKARHMGLGRYPEVALKEARIRCQDQRRLLKDPDNPQDPLEIRRAKLRAKRSKLATQLTFEKATKRFLESKKSEWKNPKSAQQWENTLRTYAYPRIGSMLVEQVDTNAVHEVLAPIWTTKNETATRLRGRIEAVIDAAKVWGLPIGENPARWKGHLDKLLPKPSRVNNAQHHPALPVDDLPTFMHALRHENGTAAFALEFAILTATRTKETAEARWEEIDLAKREWIIPRHRMKADHEHHVPLSDRAVKILQETMKLDSDYVFPGQTASKHLSNGAMLALIKRMHTSKLKADNTGWTDKQGKRVTTHGFRATFRDWAGEHTHYAREVIEHAMSHKVGDKAEQAYARGTLYKKRKELMADWDRACSQA